MSPAARAVRALRRRRPHLALACVVAGLALAPAGPVGPALAAACAAAGGAFTFGRRGCLTAFVLVVGAGWLGSARIAAIDRPARAAPPGSVIQATATILQSPRPGRFDWSAPMRIDTGRARGLRVWARAAPRAWPAAAGPGLRVRLRGLVRDPGAQRGISAETRGSAEPRTPAGRARPSSSNAGRPGTPGFGPLSKARDDGFDFAGFLRSRGIGRELHVEWMQQAGRRAGVAGLVDAVRRRAERALGTGLSTEEAALARGMVLGDDTDISDDVRDDFQRSGLAHLLAASGANVALLCALAVPLLAAARAGPRTRVAVLLALVGLYVPLAGSGASVQRAGVMAAAALVALAAGRPGSTSYALLLAAAVTLGMNPRASGDPGWQLSFAAVAGMMALGPRIARPLRRLPRLLAEGLGATAAATVSTAPLMAHQFGAVSLAALPANLVVLPAVAPIMWIGMGEGALGQLGALGHAPAALAAALSHAAAAINGLALRLVAATAAHFAQPGWAQAGIKLSWPATAATYAVGAVTAAAVARGGPRLRAAAEQRLGELFDAWRAMPARSKRTMVALALALPLAAAAAFAAPPRPPARLTVDYLDVGQGDATLVRDPAGASVLFDGGPPEARVDRLLRRLGVRRLSVVVATHSSRDHHGGLLAVIKRFPVGLFLDGGDGTRDPTFAALEHEVDRRGVRRLPARAGEVLHAGALTIRIVWPTPLRGGAPPDDPNQRATVAIVSEGGFSMLLSADAESPVLVPLRLPSVDAIKVPHHGSADPGLPDLLDRLRPRVAGIEVGRGNDYGHPTPSTLDALRARVPLVYRTDRDGTVELTVHGGRIEVRTHR